MSRPLNDVTNLYLDTMMCLYQFAKHRQLFLSFYIPVLLEQIFFEILKAVHNKVKGLCSYLFRVDTNWAFRNTERGLFWKQ